MRKFILFISILFVTESVFCITKIDTSIHFKTPQTIQIKIEEQMENKQWYDSPLLSAIVSVIAMGITAWVTWGTSKRSSNTVLTQIKSQEKIANAKNLIDIEQKWLDEFRELSKDLYVTILKIKFIQDDFALKQTLDKIDTNEKYETTYNIKDFTEELYLFDKYRTKLSSHISNNLIDHIELRATLAQLFLLNKNARLRFASSDDSSQEENNEEKLFESHQQKLQLLIDKIAHDKLEEIYDLKTK